MPHHNPANEIRSERVNHEIGNSRNRQGQHTERERRIGTGRQTVRIMIET